MTTRSSQSDLRRNTPPKRRNRLLALEPRVLFDGVALHDASSVDHDTATRDTAPASDVAAIAAPQASAPAAREIVFIDSAVPDANVLAAGVRDGVLVIRLDAQQDPFEQIANVLEQNPGTSTVHLVSHGGTGFFTLGGRTVTESDLDAHAAALSQWRDALAQDADLMIYGCDVAAEDAGQRFIERLAAMSGADVAASRDATGAATAGGDWTLEAVAGTVASTGFLTPEGAANYQARLSTQALNGNTGWVPIMIGTNFDPQGDSQAKAADTDIVGDPSHAAVFAAYDDGGTTGTTADDTMAFRIRIDNPTSSTNFGGVAIIGMDADLNGSIDIFFAVDGRNNGQSIRILDPGTGANTSPNTTSTAALPTGWVASNGVYSFSNSNYAVNAVASGTDPHWSGDNDLGNDGKTDVFVSFKVPFADIAAVLAKPSPTDRSGTSGPRGMTGIQNFTKNTVVQYVAMTQTQLGPINGDIGGIGPSYDKNASFSSLGTYSAQMSPSNPVSASDAANITDPVDANGLINATEDNAVTIQGTATANGWVRLVISDTDGGTGDITVWTQANGSGAWSVTGQDLSGLAEGTITFTASLVTANASNTTVTGSTGDSASATHDTIGPVIGIASLGTSGKPLISGTSTDVPAGSTITIKIDPNGDGTLTDLITYTAVVGAGGTWSVNTATVTPSSGTMPATGLTAYAKITAEAQDAAGNLGTGTAITKPTVTAQTTNDTTPTITGTWGGTNGGTDTLTVTVNNVTYTSGGGNLAVSGMNWSLTIPGGSALNTVGSPYEVTATVTRNGVTSSDTTSSELTLVSGPAITITGGASASSNDATPLIQGTTTLAQGSIITVRIDPNGDDNLADAVTYVATVAAGGAWSIDTGSATPISGTFPYAGIDGLAKIRATATDASGTSAVADQNLTVTIPSVSIGTITGANNGTGLLADNILNNAEDDSVTISGTSSNVAGQTVTVTVTDGTTTKTATGTVQNNGTWSVVFSGGSAISGLKDGSLTVNATVSTASDASYVAHDATPPAIRVNSPATLSNNNQIIEGVSDLANGKSVLVSIVTSAGATVQHTVTVTDGKWVTPTLALPSGSTTITVSSTDTDTAGNAAVGETVTRTVSSNNGFKQPTLGIGTVAGDNIIVSTEITGGLTLSGTYNTESQSEKNGTITITIAGKALSDGSARSLSKTYTFSNASSGSWSVALTKAEVEAYANGTLTVTASLTVSGNNASSTALPLLALTNGVGQTVAVDMPIGDGNLSATEDGPGMTITGTATNANAQTISLTVSDTDGATSNVTGTATVAANGTWSVSGLDLSSLSNGTLTVTATLGSVSGTATVLHDKTPPLITVSSGPGNTDSTPILQGTSDLSPGTTLTVAVDSDANGSTDVTYSTTVQSDGSWSINTETAQPSAGTFPADGLTATSKVTVTGSDAAGNSTSLIATTITAINGDTGISGSDFVTNDQTLVFTGKAEPNSSVAVSLNGSAIGTATADGTGAWSLNHTGTTLAAGSYTLTAVATKSTGVTATATQSFTIDITAPAVAISSISSDSAGASTSDYITNDTTLVYTGTAEANSSVLVTLTDAGNATIFSRTVTATGGNWSVDRTDYALADGTYTLTAVATDSAGNSSTTATKTVVVDTAATIGITTNYKSRDTTPLITGTTDIEVGRTITVEIDPNNDGNYADAQTYTTTVQAGGNWSVEATSALSGTVGIRASGTDAAGNSATATRSLVIDTAAPVVAVTEPIGDGNLSASEDDAVVIQGSTTSIASGSILQVSITDGTITINDTATVGSDGSWQLAALNLSGMANGTLTVTASYADDAGVPYSDTATVLHNKAGSITIDSISNDTGTPSDFITSDQTLVFSGSAAANASVTLTLSGPSGGFTNQSVTANASGVWTYNYTGTTLSSGTYTLEATSGSTVTRTIVVDTTAPGGPVTVVAQTTADTTPTITGTATLGAGESLSVTVNGLTYTVGDGNLTRNGNAWSLSIPAANALTPASTSGGFNGVYQVVATIKDAAGNILSDSTSNELTIQDVTAPVIDLDPSAAGSGNGTGVNHSATSISGAATSLDDNGDAASVTEASDKLTRISLTVASLQDGASEKLVFGNTTVAADGSSGTQTDITVGGVRVNVTYSNGVFTLQKYNYAALTAAEAQSVIRDIQYQNTAATVTTGTRTFTFSTTDDAGNASSNATASIIVSVATDTTPPVITGPSGSAGDATSAKTINENTTAVATLTANESVTWSIVGGVDQAKFSIDANGALRFATAPDYENPTDTDTNNTYVVQVRAADAAGNASTQTVTVTVANVDEVAPTITGPSGSAGDATSAKTINENTTAVATLTANESVTWSLVGGDDQAKFSIDANGALRFATAPDYETPTDTDTNNTYVVQVRATDAAGNASTQTVTVTVANVDEVAPIVTGPSGSAGDATSAKTINENTTAVATLTANESVTWSIVGGDDQARFSIDANGALRFATAPDYETPTDTDTNNTYVVQVRATDAAGNASTQTVTVTVANVDEVAPVITGPSGAAGDATSAKTINENTTAVATLVANESVTWSIVGGDDQARFSIDANGALRFATAPDYETPTDTDTNNTYVVQVRATDAAGNASTQTVTVTVANVDEVAPIITGPSGSAGDATSAKTINENTTAVATLTANESVTWSIVGGDDQARFSIDANGALRFATAPDYENPTDTDTNNTYVVQVRATDAAGNASTQTVTVTVANVDEVAPVITGPSGSAGDATSAKTVNENTTAVATLTANESVIWSLVGGDDQAKFSIDANGALRFATAPDYENPTDTDTNNTYVAQVRAADAAGNASTQTVTVTVANVDEIAPVITGPSGSAGDATSAKTINENTTAVATLTANESVTWSIVGGVDQARFSIDANGALRFATAPDYETPTDTDTNNTYVVQVRATDAAGNASTQTVTVTVANVDEIAPVITGPSGSAGDATSAKTINENTTAVATLTANESVTWSIVGGDDQAKFSIDANGALRFATAPDFENPTDTDTNNTYVVQVRATDGSGNTSNQTVTVTVANVDENAPIITGPSGSAGDATSAKTINENTTAVATLTANESVTWSIVGGDDQAKFSIDANGALRFATAPDYENPTDTDTNNTYLVQVRATDTDGNASTQTVTVTVTNVDEVAPVITGPSGAAGDATSAKTINENTTAVATLTANESVTWSIVGGVDQARFSIDANGALRFATAPDYENPTDTDTNNTYVVQVRAADAAGNASTQTVTVTVANVDEVAPIITGPSGSAGDATSAKTINENTTAVATLTANESVTWSIVGGDDQAKFSIDANGALRFATAPDYENPTDTDTNNTYLVQVRATDTDGNASTQTVTVTVANVDEVAPVITGPSGSAGDAASAKTINENTTAVATLTANESATWSLVGGDDQARFSIDANGALRFATAPDYENPTDTDTNNTYVVQVRATDGSGNASTQTVTVTVTNVDEVAPIITGPSGAAGDATSAKTINENTTAVATLTANESVTWSIVGGDDQAKFSIDANGALRFATAPDYETPTDTDTNNTYVVQVRATDAAGNASTQTVTVTVANVDEVAPIITGPSGAAGDATSAKTINENTTAVATLTANESVTWSIVGGDDQAKFSIDANGALRFANAPDFETPTDTDTNNTYVVQVRATDGSGNAAIQTVTVTVANMDENVPLITGPSGSAGDATSAKTINENTTAVATLTANESVTWSIVGGDDQAKFSIDANGALRFATAPDFETPTDTDTNNTYLVQVRATDTDGNASTQTVTVTVANVDEVAPIITGPSGSAGDATSAKTINENTTAVATLTANESVTWSIVGGGDQAKFSIDANGALRFATAPDYETPTDTDTNNTYVVQVRATDSTGNASTQTVTVTVANVDESGPDAPGLDLLAASDSGISASDNKTSDTTPTIRVILNGTGAAAPVSGDEIKLYEDVTVVGSATLSAQNILDGYVDVTSSALSTGSKSFTATVTDSAGFTSSPSSAMAVTLDTTAPALSSANVNGTTLTLSYSESGTGMASSTPAAGDFQVTKNGTTTVSVSAVAVNATNRTVTLTLAQALTNTDTVSLDYTPGATKIEDVAGNSAAALSGQTVTNSSSDITAPAAPQLALLAASDSGSSNSDAYTNDTTPTIRATLQGTGATAPVAGDVVTLSMNGSSVGSATLSASDIANTYVDITTSALGSDGVKSLTAIVTDAANNASAASDALAITLDTIVNAPTVTLSSDSGASGSDRITRFGSVGVDGIETGATLEYSTNGTSWTGSVSPAEGSNTVYVRQTDRAGNVSAASSVSFTLDTRITAPQLSLQNDTGRSGTDRITRISSLATSGVEANATVEYSADGVNWGASAAATEGANTVFVRQTDLAGNISSASSISFTLDTTIATPTVALQNDTGISNTDRVTRDATLAVGGIETNATVEYSSDGATWSSGFTAVEGSNTVLVRQTDVAGNVSGTASLSFTYDPVPTAPTVSLAADTGSSGTDRITRNGALTIGGLKQGASVQYSLDGVTWSSGFTPVEGANTVFVRQVTVFGTPSEAASLSFTLDTRIEPPSISLITDSGASASDMITNSSALAVGNIEAGATVQYSSDGANWSGSFSPLEGANTVYVRQTDVAGNISGASSIAFRLDTQVAAPAVSMASSNGGPVVSDAALTVSGIETGASVEYSTDGSGWSGGYTATEGPNTVYVRQTDLAGNVSPAASVSFTLNTLTALPPTSTTTTTTTTATPGPTTDTGGGTGNTATTPDATIEASRPGSDGSGTPPVVETVAPVVTGSQPAVATSGSALTFNGAADQTSAQQTGRINLLAGIPLPPDAARPATAGPENAVLASSDRGFPVSRVQSTETQAANDGNSAALVQAQQKGNDRLFVYQGIGDTAVPGGTAIDYFVPREAFGHTNVSAVVQLDAALVDGSPLPEWLDFDPVSGRFSGRAPGGGDASLEIKVIARDNDGREASSTFKIKLQAGDAKETKPAAQPNADAKDTSPLKNAADLPSRKSHPFGEQLRMAKPARDPLLARIAATDGKALKNAKGQRTS